jgi:hypothetical protein
VRRQNGLRLYADGDHLLCLRRNRKDY